MIVVIAPYAPIGSNTVNLGAARKIELFVDVIASFQREVLLINSAHDECVRSDIKVGARKVGARVVTEITPPLHKKRQIGKFLNLLNTGKIASLIENIGKVELVWIYNAYAFEAKMANELAARFGCKVIVELEDSVNGRSRGLNPKPIFDRHYWGRLKGRVSGAVYVNKKFEEQYLTEVGDSRRMFLPGVVDNRVAQVPFMRKAFSDPETTTIGYFGGLSAEKGVDGLMDLIKEINCDRYRFIICGTGPLESSLRNMKAPAAKFRFSVSYEEMVSLMAECDILVNPHKVTKRFLSGIFPSKVLEGVVTERLYVSTDLPDIGNIEIFKAIEFYDGSLVQLKEIVCTARDRYHAKEKTITLASSLVRDRMSSHSVRDWLESLLHGQ